MVFLSTGSLVVVFVSTGLVVLSTLLVELSEGGPPEVVLSTAGLVLF